MAADLENVRSTLASLSSDIQSLSKDFVHSPNHPFTPDSELVVKAKQIIALAQPSQAHILDTAIRCMEAAALSTLSHLGALQAIPETGSIILEDLASKAKAQASLLARLLRALVSTGLLKHSTNHGYAHTPISAAYAGQSAGMFAMLFESGIGPLALLPDWLEHTYPPSSGNLPSEPTGIEASTHNPLTYKNRAEGQTAFDVLAKKPEVAAALQQSLAMSFKANPVVRFYDYGKLALPANEKDSGRKVLVDVGGGHGQAVSAILTTHPELATRRDHPFVLQDREEVLAAITDPLPAAVKTQVHDFFKPQSVKGARAYHIRACLHDWSDDVCISILSNIVPAMAKDSVLLIAENIVPQDPGEVSRLTAFMDMGMLVIGGKERTEADFEALVQAAGLKINDVFRAPAPSLHGILECMLA